MASCLFHTEYEYTAKSQWHPFSVSAMMEIGELGLCHVTRGGALACWYVHIITVSIGKFFH